MIWASQDEGRLDVKELLHAFHQGLCYVTVAMVGYIEYTLSLLDADIYRSGPPQLPHSGRVERSR